MQYAVVLRIAGIPQVLFGGAGTFTPEPDPSLPEGVDLEPLQVIDLRKFQGQVLGNKLPHQPGVGPASTLTLDLVDVGRQLQLLFSRTIDETTWVRLSESVPADDDSDFLAADVPEAFPASGIAYSGTETFSYSEIDETGFLVDTRGVLGSQIRAHLVDSLPTRSFKANVTLHPIVWANRPVRLYLHRVYRGVVQPTAEKEIFRGVIGRDPEPTETGYMLELFSSLQRWKMTVGTALETTYLVDGFHYFDGDAASSIAMGEFVPLDAISSVDNASVLDAEHLEDDGSIEVVSVDTLRNAFGVARGNFDGDASIAYLILRGAGLDQEPSVPSSYGAAGSTTITLAEDNMPEVLAGLAALGIVRVVNLPVIRNLDTPVTLSGLCRWPEAAVDAFNAAVHCNRGAGATANFVDCTLDADGRRVRVAVSGYDYHQSLPPQLIPRRLNKTRTNLWYPLFRQPEDVPEDILEGPAAQPGGAAGVGAEPEPAGYPVGLHELLRPPTAFWCGGTYLLIQDDVLPAASEEAPGKVRIRLKNKKVLELDYSDVTEVTYDGERIGFRATITEACRQKWWREERIPFGNWFDSRGNKIRAEITVGAGLEGDPREMLVQMMLSGSGTTGFPDADYSLLPRVLGLSMFPDEVDVEGILAFPLPAVFADRTLKDFFIEKNSVAEDVVRGILQAMSAALVMKDIGGVQKITLVPLRAGVAAASATIRDGESGSDWEAGGRPNKPRFSETVTTWQFETNFDQESGKPLRTPLMYDADALDNNGGMESMAEKVELRGMHFDSDTELVLVFQTLRARYGRKARLFSGRVMGSIANQIDIGDVVNVNIRYGVDENRRAVTITGRMLVTSVEKNPLLPSAGIELELLPSKNGRIAPVATVTDVVDVDTLEFSGDPSYAQAGTPADYQWFLDDWTTVPEAGIPILAVRVGEEQFNASKTITAVDTENHRLTVTGHGLSVGDRIRGRSYDESNAWLQLFVHMHKRGAAGIGTGEVAPWEYL